MQHIQNKKVISAFQNHISFFKIYSVSSFFLLKIYTSENIKKLYRYTNTQHGQTTTIIVIEIYEKKNLKKKLIYTKFFILLGYFLA